MPGQAARPRQRSRCAWRSAQAPRRCHAPQPFPAPLMLIGSNIVMTWAWYGHLKRPGWAMWLAILVS